MDITSTIPVPLIARITLDVELNAINHDKWQSSKNRLALIYKHIDSEGIELYSE
jgi:hypothetical protein